MQVGCEICSLNAQVPFDGGWLGTDWKSLGSLNFRKSLVIRTEKPPSSQAEQCHSQVGKWSARALSTVHSLRLG